MLTMAVLVAVAATSKPDSDAKPVREPAPVTRRVPAPPPPPPPRRVMPMPIVRAAAPTAAPVVRIGVPVEPRRPNPAPIAEATSAPIYRYQNPQPVYDYIPIYYYVPIYGYFGYNGFSGYSPYSYGSYPAIANYSAELQGYIIERQGNSLIVETPSQQLILVDASYVLGSSYSRYRFMPGQFVDFAGYYYGNEFVATALF